MQYKKRSAYTRFFTSFLIATIVLEIGVVFFLPSSFGVKEVSAAECNSGGETFEDVISQDEKCKDFCSDMGYTVQGFLPGADCCCAIPKCKNNSCAPQGNRRNAKSGENCREVCANTSEVKVCTLSSTPDCCCDKAASVAAPAPAPTAACNKLTNTNAAAEKCGDICKQADPNKWRDGTFGGGDICCCIAGASGGTAPASAGVLSCTGATCDFKNPLQAAGDKIQNIVGGIIKAIIGIVGSLALFMFVWGGFLWLSAAGDEERIKNGRETMTWSVLGLLAVFGAYVGADFLLNQLFLKSMT